jgi:UDP-glucose 4-epimerase
MTTRYLILGGNGFIGSHLVERLLRAGCHVRVYDRGDNRYQSRLPDVEYIYGELGNGGLIRAALSDIDVVCHLISTTVPGNSNDDPAFDVQSNVVDSIRLLEASVAARVKRFVFTSSGGTVYGIPQHTPIDENHPLNPISSYGIAKLAIEKYLAMFRHLHGLEYGILRPANAYGERQNPFGQQGLIAVMMGKVLRGEPIVVWGDGSVVRDYVHVTDLAEALYRLMTHPLKGDGIFNCGSGSGVSVNDVLAMLQRVVGHPVEVRYVEARRFDVPVNVLDTRRARAQLGWTPQIDLEAGLERTWVWMRSVFTPDGVMNVVARET